MMIIYPLPSCYVFKQLEQTQYLKLRYSLGLMHHTSLHVLVSELTSFILITKTAICSLIRLAFSVCSLPLFQSVAWNKSLAHLVSLNWWTITFAISVRQSISNFSLHNSHQRLNFYLLVYLMRYTDCTSCSISISDQFELTSSNIS